MYQPQDFFFKKAKKEGYPARSVYKLKEIDQKFHIFHPNDFVLDLGCAPGSWLLYIQKVTQPKGKVVGIDLTPLTITLSAIFLQKDVFQLKQEELEKILIKEGKRKFDVIVSDLAPNTSGIKDVDEQESLDLMQRAFYFATFLLKDGGSFVCKVFESYEVHCFAKEINSCFKFFKIFKPRACRKRSKELYFVGKKYRAN